MLSMETTINISIPTTTATSLTCKFGGMDGIICSSRIEGEESFPISFFDGVEYRGTWWFIVIVVITVAVVTVDVA